MMEGKDEKVRKGERVAGGGAGFWVFFSGE